jgi:hypothetical protein
MLPENSTHRPGRGYKPAKYDDNCSHQSGEQSFLDRSFRHIAKTNDRTEIDQDERQQAQRLLLYGATYFRRPQEVKFKFRIHVSLDVKDERTSGAGWRQKLQPVFLPNFNYARNLLLLRTQRPNLLEKSFKACRCKDGHEPPGFVADVTITVRHTARGKDSRAFPGHQRLPSTREFIVSFENLESLVLAMMNVRWRTSARVVRGFYYTQDTTGVATVETDNDSVSDNTDRFPFARGNEHGVHW